MVWRLFVVLVKNVHKKLILHGVSEVLRVLGVSGVSGVSVAYEQELKEKLYSALKSKAKINDLSEKLVDKYNEREKKFENKASQLIASSTKVRSQLIFERKSHSKSQRELEVKYTAKIQSLKSEIKTLKRKMTLVQKASSADKVQILSLETKIRKLEESLRLELERANEDRNSKEYTIECMEKGIEVIHEITSQEIDALYST
ncbi:hypothetical protein C1646_821118 [Rhizophagus diaphanus]|nr:hypothetical protein C1646_821118 [Rhizophagus diaphanus] [Rhizophagus sp. MUCL 43196]